MDELYPIRRISSYELVDPAIREWCRRHSLTLCTTDRDCDVRTVQIVGTTGSKCQVWIDPPENGVVTVNVWSYSPPRERITVRIEEIAAALERAYKVAIRFVSAK